MLRRLEGLVERETSPSDDADLVFMTRLLQLAVGARSMLREKQYKFPEPSHALLHVFYPILTGYILEVQLREADEADGECRWVCITYRSFLILLSLLIIIIITNTYIPPEFWSFALPFKSSVLSTTSSVLRH